MDELPLCKCGCGKSVAKEGNRFIHGHNMRGTTHSVSEETRRKISKANTGVPKPPRTVEHCAAISIVQKGVPKSPEHGDAISKAKKGIPNSTEHNAAISAGQKGAPKSPEHCAAISKGCEKFIGGNDLVTHHYIYDHSDLSLNTVQMTRSDHTNLHMLLKKLGYKVPHINIKEN